MQLLSKSQGKLVFWSKSHKNCYILTFDEKDIGIYPDLMTFQTYMLNYIQNQFMASTTKSESGRDIDI